MFLYVLGFLGLNVQRRLDKILRPRKNILFTILCNVTLSLVGGNDVTSELKNQD